jgi:hypothetical protein
MSVGFQIIPPTDQEIADYMAQTGADIINATKALQLKSALAAIDLMADLTDAKAILRVIVRRLVPLL